MNAYKIIASDLDGTLLQNDMTLSAENACAITAIANMGIQFVPASGRTLAEIPDAVKNHPSIRYIIYSNGATIWDKHTDRHTRMCMSKQTSNALLDMLNACDTHITVRQGGVSYVDTHMRSNECYAYYHALPTAHYGVLEQYGVFVEDFKNLTYAMDNVESVAVFFHNNDEMLACREKLMRDEALYAAVGFPYNLEIFSSKAGKDNALLCLAEMLHIPPAATISIGDSGNDIRMTEAAGMGLVTANACDELKAVADAIICANTAHVAKYVLEHYLK